MNGANDRIKYIARECAAWSIIPLAYLSWCFSTIAYKNEGYIRLSMLIAMAAAVIYAYLIFMYNDPSDRISDEILCLDMLIVAGGLCFEAVIKSEYPYSNAWCISLAAAIWVAVSAYDIWKRFISTGRFRSVFRGIKQYSCLIILLSATAILSVDTDIYQFKWDGLLYYSAVEDALLSSVSSVALYGHVAMSAGAAYRFFAVLIRDVGYGMITANILVLLLATCAFYGILKTVIPGRKDIEYSLGTACFSFSPFLMGMAGYFSTDWFSVCLAIVLIYAILSKRWIMTAVFGCVFCMTKEPALICYTGICLGMVVNDIFADRKMSGWIRRILSKAHYYFMLIPYLLWFATYRILGQWSAGEGGFGIDKAYMIEKLKVFFVLNFNWLITLIFVICLIILIKDRKLKELMFFVLPVILGNAFLLLFNLMFKTVNHPRYIDSFISLNIALMAVTLMAAVKKDGIRYACYVMILVLELISCVRCIDPISILAFESIDTGKARLLSTDGLLFGDSSIYNRQMLWLEKPFSQAVSDAIDEDTAIVVAVADGSVYSFDGMSETINLNGDINRDTLFWDSVNRRRIPYCARHDETVKPVPICHVRDGVPVDSADCEKDAISVIYIRGINEYTISDSYVKTGEKDYSYRGWVITRDIYSLR